MMWPTPLQPGVGHTPWEGEDTGEEPVSHAEQHSVSGPVCLSRLLSTCPQTWRRLQRVSCALTPADRVEVPVVSVAPDVKLLGPAVVMDLQVDTPVHNHAHQDGHAHPPVPSPSSRLSLLLWQRGSAWGSSCPRPPACGSPGNREGVSGWTEEGTWTSEGRETPRSSQKLRQDVSDSWSPHPNAGSSTLEDKS